MQCMCRLCHVRTTCSKPLIVAPTFGLFVLGLHHCHYHNWSNQSADSIAYKEIPILNLWSLLQVHG